VNADDWGRDAKTTERTLDCFLRGAISSVSAMVFMEDSARGAALAREREIDAGLHLNLTTPFSGSTVPARLVEHQHRISEYLGRHRLAQVVFHPALVRSFEYVVSAQREEFWRLYGKEPNRIDGHHHMHLCSNVVLTGLMPAGAIIRRNVSFERGEKSWFNYLYRNVLDRIVASRHGVTDFFFSLPPLDPPSRLQKIFSLANDFVVEIETHPVNAEEYRFLAGAEIFRRAGDLPIAPRYMTSLEVRSGVMESTFQKLSARQ
jgi:predicted glycoside hydrolase/deacetylase ChbG (UPF0249 family)